MDGRIQAELKNGYYHITLFKKNQWDGARLSRGIRVKESEFSVNHIKDLLRWNK